MQHSENAKDQPIYVCEDLPFRVTEARTKDPITQTSINQSTGKKPRRAGPTFSVGWLCAMKGKSAHRLAG